MNIQDAIAKVEEITNRPGEVDITDEMLAPCSFLLEHIGKLETKLYLYETLFGTIEDPYGKIDTLLAIQTYKEKESFHKNFGRYMDAAKARLEKLK